MRMRASAYATSCMTPHRLHSPLPVPRLRPAHALPCAPHIIAELSGGPTRVPAPSPVFVRRTSSQRNAQYDVSHSHRHSGVGVQCHGLFGRSAVWCRPARTQQAAATAPCSVSPRVPCVWLAVKMLRRRLRLRLRVRVRSRACRSPLPLPPICFGCRFFLSQLHALLLRTTPSPHPLSRSPLRFAMCCSAAHRRGAAALGPLTPSFSAELQRKQFFRRNRILSTALPHALTRVRVSVFAKSYRSLHASAIHHSELQPIPMLLPDRLPVV